MNKKIFVIAALIIGMIACFSSCKKDDNAEPVTPVSPDVNPCQHDSLVYVLPVTPTEDENGCVEHYRCAKCGATFADAQGQTPLENPILWATGYFINTDHLEAAFDQFEGDQSFMRRALLESALGKIQDNDVDIWDDYSNWENWTKEEWDEFWQAAATYFGWDDSGKNTDNVNVDLVTCFAAAQFLTTVISVGLENIDGSFKAFFDPNWKINAKLDQIIGKIDELQKAIKQISDQITLLEYKTVMNDRAYNITLLDNATNTFFQAVLNEITNAGANFSELPQATISRIRKISEDWYGTNSTSNPEVVLKTLLDFAAGDFITNKKLPAVYDEIARRTIPWEHEGYGFRETARAIDALVMAESYVMSLIYYNTHLLSLPYAEMELTILNQKMGAYINILRDNPVVHHDNEIICQIPGAEMRLEKQLKRIDAYSYIKSHENNMSLQSDSDINNFMDAVIGGHDCWVRGNWINNLFYYYHGRKNRYYILYEAGFENVDGGLIVCDTEPGYKADPDGRTGQARLFNWYCEWAIGGSNKDYISFNNVVLKRGNFNENWPSMMLFDWASYHIADEMDIRFSDKMIKGAGKKSYNNFIAIKRIK